MPGARCARSRACSVENTRVSHHGHTGSPGIPRAMVLTVSFVLSPVTGLCCHRHLADKSTKLDASVGASGPHDFAVRLSAVRQRHRHVHRIPPHVRDDRETPLVKGRDGRSLVLIWDGGEAEYFCDNIWTGQISLIRHDKLVSARISEAASMARIARPPSVSRTATSAVA
jgi:hypothetical protein